MLVEEAGKQDHGRQQQRHCDDDAWGGGFTSLVPRGDGVFYAMWDLLSDSPMRGLEEMLEAQKPTDCAPWTRSQVIRQNQRKGSGLRERPVIQ